ncbi:uncharacterized protein CLUP02_09154 [Colletotrichum lupini]|uniref:Uncharacterized protein n=1 Tax=Colletotrichum lupini TaxID=145971 RepID=A0A9Q8SUV9_9PEZI|nr:uncharacterized protein CLUP02_09154 [Colletotrichum lupini]UQC83658.1 hypothetical protein CLUP02_09154 [Colletotrichum lupini]
MCFLAILAFDLPGELVTLMSDSSTLNSLIDIRPYTRTRFYISPAPRTWELSQWRAGYFLFTCPNTKGGRGCVTMPDDDGGTITKVKFVALSDAVFAGG